MPDKYEDGKTQYKSHNRERKYLFITESERKIWFLFEEIKV